MSRLKGMIRDPKNAEKILRQRWGKDFQTNQRIVADYAQKFFTAKQLAKLNEVGLQNDPDLLSDVLRAAKKFNEKLDGVSPKASHYYAQVKAANQDAKEAATRIAFETEQRVISTYGPAQEGVHVFTEDEPEERPSSTRDNEKKKPWAPKRDDQGILRDPETGLPALNYNPSKGDLK